MKRLALIALIFATPASAQQQFTPQQSAMVEMGQQIGLLRSALADAQIQNLTLAQENTKLTKQNNELNKQIQELTKPKE